MRPQITLTACGLLLLFLVGGLRSAPLSDAQRQEDAALGRRVTLVAQRIYVGEMIGILSHQTDTPLSVGAQDGSGDVEVAVSLRDVPLADAMNALWSLVSYRSADWDWARSGTPGHYRYRLERPQAARALAQQLKQQIQEDFVGQTQKMLLGLKMPPDKLQEEAKSDPLLASLVDNKDPRVRPEMEIVADLTPKLLDGILNDGQSVQIPVSQLSGPAQEFVRQQWLWTRDHGGMTRKPDGTMIPVPEPQSIGVTASRIGQDLAPSLSVDCGFGGGDLTGGGWMEKDWHHRLAAWWMRPGDAADDARATGPVPAPQARVPEGASVRPLARHITQLGKAASIPVIARLPDERGMGSNISALAPYGMTVRAYLDRLRGLHLESKWRGGVLLITDPSWFMRESDDTAAPWASVAALRDAEAAAPDGCLPLTALLHTAGTLNPTQVASLAEQFPVMAGLAAWHDLFALMAHSSELPSYMLSPSGSTRTDAMQAASKVLHIDALLQDGTAKHIRLTQTQITGERAGRKIMVDVLDRNGNTLAGQGFEYVSRQFQSGAESGPGASGVGRG